jgi:outer membrane lipoprotein-sorting protein
MRKLAVCLFLGLSTIALGGAGPLVTTIPQRTIYNRADLDTLNRVSAYLNSMNTLESGFIQVGADGRIDQGQLYISKPGRMRFEYRPPSTLLVVSDGRNVVVKNGRLNTIDRYSLSNFPLSVILGNKVDLARNSAIMKVVKQNGAILVYARSVATKTQGDIILVFSEPTLELRQWSQTDNQGKSVTVTLRDTVAGKPIDEAKFVLPTKNIEPKKAPG